MATRQEQFQASSDYRDPVRQVGGGAMDPTGGFYAKISAFSAPVVLEAGAARWLYTWSKVTIGPGPLYHPVQDPNFHSGKFGSAINIAELTHIPKVGVVPLYVADVQCNPDAGPTGYPAIWSPRPVGEKFPQVVWMWFERAEDAEGNPIRLPVFFCRNSHDGVCAF